MLHGEGKLPAQFWGCSCEDNGVVFWEIHYSRALARDQARYWKLTYRDCKTKVFKVEVNYVAYR